MAKSPPNKPQINEGIVVKEQIRTTTRKKKLIGALIATMGVVTNACKLTGIGRAQFYEWKKNDPEFEAQVLDVEDIAVDFSEYALHKKIGDGDTAAIIFHLKTKGKNRGYVERTQQELSGKVSLNLDLTKLSDGELNALESITAKLI